MKGVRVFEKIREMYSSLPKQQQLVAEAILEGGSQIALLTAKNLSARTGVSSATIVRFAHRLGFEGYPEFARELQHFFYEENAPMQKLKESFDGPLGKQEILGHVCEMDRENLLQLEQAEMEQTLARVAQRMIDARRVVLTGGRTSYSLVHYAGFLLRQLDGKFSFFDSSVGDAYERIENLHSEDVLMAISFHRYYRKSRDLAVYGKELGAFVVALTDAMQSPLVPAADAVLLGANKAPFYSYVPAMAILNALIAIYAKGMNLSSREVFERRSKLLLDKDVYV